MGRSKNYDIPEEPIEVNFTERPSDFHEKKADVVLYREQERNKGVTIFSAERWYMRIWLYCSNPFRYLFTGRTRF